MHRLFNPLLRPFDVFPKENESSNLLCIYLFSDFRAHLFHVLLLLFASFLNVSVREGVQDDLKKYLSQSFFAQTVVISKRSYFYINYLFGYIFRNPVSNCNFK